MARLTREEREQKKLLQAQKREERRKAKEGRQQQQADEKKHASDDNVAKRKKEQQGTLKNNSDSDVGDDKTNNNNKKKKSQFLQLPEDAMQVILCYLPCKELGCLTLSCCTFNNMLSECRIPHIISRLNQPNVSIKGCVGYIDMVCSNNNGSLVDDACKILSSSLNDAGNNTGRLITKRCRKQSNNFHDEYVGYARFLDEGIGGYSPLSVGGKKSPTLLPYVTNGRFASASPEHTVLRLGGDGTRCGPISGVATYGVGRRGQLGHGKRDDEKTPKRLPGGIGYKIRIVQVSAGGGLVRVAHTLLLTSTGRVLSFGTAQYGQLGHGYSQGKQLNDETRPRYIDALSHETCICVSAGELHSAAVTADGDVYTWGDGFCGQLGLGDKRPQLLPKQITTGGLDDEVVTTVSCGNRHTLIVTEDGDVFSCGLGHFGVLGRNFTPFEYDADAAVVALGGGVDDHDEPPPVAMIAPAVSMMNEQADADNSSSGNTAGGVVNATTAAARILSMGEDNVEVPPHVSAALAAELGGGGDGDGGVDSSGNALDGDNIEIPQQQQGMSAETLAHIDLIANLSLDDNSDQCIPKVIDSLEGVKIVGASAGHRHSMLLDENGGLYTCGSGVALGHGNYDSYCYPMKVLDFVEEEVKIIQISAGVDMSMAVSTTGNVYAWGKSDGGRIGLGMNTGNVTLPRRVYVNDTNGDPAKAVDVECGYVHSIIVGLSGAVYQCGGVGTHGEDDGQQDEPTETNTGQPIHINDVNIWHRLSEPKVHVKKEKWKKYGKYEIQGRSKMMAQP